MNQAHYHLALNHLPIIIPIIGLIVLAGGLILKSEVVKRTAFFIFILGALFTIPALLTGEGAEEAVEQIQDVSEQFIETHEETAETFAIFSYILGSISLIGFWANYKKKSFTNIIAIIITIFAVAVLFFAKETGTTGGEIRHSEIRSGANFNTNNPERNSTKNKNVEDNRMMMIDFYKMTSFS